MESGAHHPDVQTRRLVLLQLSGAKDRCANALHRHTRDNPGLQIMVPASHLEASRSPRSRGGQSTRRQQLADWVNVHADAFEYFGGATRAIAPDQLRSAVSAPDAYEPLFLHGQRAVSHRDRSAATGAPQSLASAVSFLREGPLSVSLWDCGRADRGSRPRALDGRSRHVPLADGQLARHAVARWLTLHSTRLVTWTGPLATVATGVAGSEKARKSGAGNRLRGCA